MISPPIFAECMVRAVELRLKPHVARRARIRHGCGLMRRPGFVRPLFSALAKFEQSEPGIRLYFPELVRSIDTATEQKRVAGSKVCRPIRAAESDRRRRRQSRDGKAAPTTIPNDKEVIAALTEGERRIAEKNPRAPKLVPTGAGEISDQTARLYGLVLVGTARPRRHPAKEVFGRLTNSESVAGKDPMVSGVVSR